MEKITILDSFILLSWLLLIVIIFILAVSLSEKNEVLDPENDFFCGTVSYEESLSRSDTLYFDYRIGKDLFRANCASCHNKNMKSDMTGPALQGVRNRWKDYPKEDLYQWIKNSQKLIQEKHPRALLLWEKWNPNMMNSFPDLSNEEIDKILIFIEQ